MLIKFTILHPRLPLLEIIVESIIRVVEAIVSAVGGELITETEPIPQEEHNGQPAHSLN